MHGDERERERELEGGGRGREGGREELCWVNYVAIDHNMREKEIFAIIIIIINKSKTRCWIQVWKKRIFSK